LWRLTGTEPPTTFTNKVYPVQSLAFSHNSQWLGAATQQLSTTGRYTSILLGDVHLWRVSDRAETKLTIGKNQDDEYDFSATAVAFSPDDKQLVADVFTEGKLPPRDCDPDEQCGDPESLPYNVRTTFFDLASGRSVTSTPLGKSDSNMSPQERGFFSLSPDGRRAFTTRDGKLSYTDTLTGRPLRSFQQPVIAPAPSDIDQCGTTAGFVTFSPDVRRIAISDGRSLAIVDAHTGAGATKEPVLLGQTVESSDITANAGEFSPDGNLLVVSTCSLSNGAKLRIYAGSNLEMRHEVGIETTETALAFTPDGEFFFSGDSNGIVRLWRSGDASLVATLVRSRNGAWLVFTPDGLFDASSYGAILLTWRIDDHLVPAADLRQMRTPGLLNKLLSGARLTPPEPLAGAIRHAQRKQ